MQLPTTTRRRTGRTSLELYLNDRIADETGGLELCRRAAEEQADPSVRHSLTALAADMAQDRATLIGLTLGFGIPVRRSHVVFHRRSGATARPERGGRSARRSPLSDLAEIEDLMLGVEGKSSLWQVLRQVDGAAGAFDLRRLDVLGARARAQAALLEGLRDEAAALLFSGSSGSRPASVRPRAGPAPVPPAEAGRRALRGPGEGRARPR